MRIIADLHMHSKHSRATSKYMDLNGIASGAKVKGIHLMGTGDFLHPQWQKELKEKLSENNGIYEYSGVNFVLTGEVSLIYKQDNIGRRVHHIIMAPDFAVLDQITEFFLKRGRVDYDGRPIFGMSSIAMTEELMKISKNIEIIPAHAWTPWFSIFGSMSGFNSLRECFGEYTKNIHAIETGLSSDPSMNWRLSQLDDITLISNSDSHSAAPHRLGREANVFDLKEPTYKNIINAIRTRYGFEYTIEVDPNFGKYHVDGHRKCGFSCPPEQSKKLNNRCPICQDKLVIGVLNRVEELADRPVGFRPKNAIGFKSVLPLMELLASVLGTSVVSKKVDESFRSLIKVFGNEFAVLLDATENEIKKVVDEKIASAIIKNREGKIKIIPGYDGVYGVPVLDESKKIENNRTKIDKEKQGLNRFV